MLPAKADEAERKRVKQQTFVFLNSQRGAIKLTYRFYLSRSMYKTERPDFLLGPKSVLLTQLKLCFFWGGCSRLLERVDVQIAFVGMFHLWPVHPRQSGADDDEGCEVQYRGDTASWDDPQASKAEAQCKWCYCEGQGSTVACHST